MFTTVQEQIQLSKNWLKLLRIVRNSYPRKYLYWELDCTHWKGFRLPGKASGYQVRPVEFYLDNSFQMSAQQGLLLVWFVSYASLKTVHVL